MVVLNNTLMKGIISGSALLLLSVLFSACGGDATQNAKSVHVDSSNINGTAPVEYGPADPADTTHSLDPSDDTGRRANTSMKNEKEQR